MLVKLGCSNSAHGLHRQPSTKKIMARQSAVVWWCSWNKGTIFRVWGVNEKRFCFSGVLFSFLLKGSDNIKHPGSVSIGWQKDALLQLPEGGGRGKGKVRMTIWNTKGALTSSPSKWQNPGRSSIPSVKLKATTWLIPLQCGVPLRDQLKYIYKNLNQAIHLS